MLVQDGLAWNISQIKEGRTTASLLFRHIRASRVYVSLEDRRMVIVDVALQLKGSCVVHFPSLQQ